MSGRKRIQVDEAEWYRIQRKAQQLKNVQRKIPKLIDEVRRQTGEDLDRVFSRVEERQQRHEEVVQGLSEQTRQLEADTARRLREQTTEVRGALAASAGQIREETRQRLAEQQQRVRQAIADERAERRAETARLSAEIGVLSQDRAQAGRAVKPWLADARSVASEIADAGLHERYAPGELDRLTGRLTTAEQNAAEGRFDAALAVAQETYHSLSELRADTEQRELERCTAQMAAIDALATVAGEIEDGREQPVDGPDGTVLPGYVVDVDYWSEGEWDRLRTEAADILARARDDGTGTDELLLLRDREAPRLEEELGETVEQATMRHLASQLRVNLADTVAQTLSRIAFYDFVDGEYQDADPRGTYYAKLRHENGNELVLDISQAAPDSGEQVVRVLSYDYDVTAEEELRNRAEAVRLALADDGRAVPAAPESEPGAPDPRFLDIEAHRRRGQQRAGRRQDQAGGRGSGA
ncbi:hypothetical protein P8A18_05410 [Streptomyces castrisilvae]|uniref:Uncharacterized protein n=1 Tax=Streptomyces castrisilvae TaxID=3033811 RepID=A0ABY9HFR8_9ACTN|nr:hypothetical protein [Streptomyces sp. Mut1]WLQ32922.1 hypothetical protein P8A18_05410 [Streptomyces sp. Mut1]